MSLSQEQLQEFIRLPDRVRAELRKWGADTSLAEDIVQETYLAVHSKIDSYDSGRSSFATWIMAIALNQAKTMLGQRAREYKRVQRAFEAAAVNDDVYGVEINQVELAHKTLENIERLSSVLNIVRACMSEDYLFERSMLLMREYDGNVELAAAQCGVKPSWLRQSHQQIIEMAVVVDGALKIHERRHEEGDTSAVTLRQILDCFPKVSDKAEKTWMKTVPRAIITSGGWTLPRAELIESVATHTGYSPVTARHLVAQCEKLFSVARAVIEQGTALAEE